MNEQEYLEDCKARYRACGYERTKDMKLEQLERMILEGQVELGRMLLQSRLEDDPRGKPRPKADIPARSASTRCGFRRSTSGSSEF